MSTAPILPRVTVDEYLSTSYEHDMEYVDGVLVERGMPTIPHSILQKLLLLWFGQYEDSGNFETLPEVRTQIIERSRYRLPDLMICPRPLPRSKVYNVVPWAVIEILSPDDTLTGTRSRFRDYASIGISQLVLMDPEEYVCYQFENGSFIENRFNALPLPDGSSVPFDSSELFARLKTRLQAE